MPHNDDINSALYVRQLEQARVVQVAAGVWDCLILLDVKGSGESVATTQFPVRFVEQPGLQVGWHMARNQMLYPGNFPQVHAGVYVWQFGRRPDYGSYFYDGATFAITVTGPLNLHITLHLSLRGLALQNPAGQ
jgi:hypothetical protein